MITPCQSKVLLVLLLAGAGGPAAALADDRGSPLPVAPPPEGTKAAAAVLAPTATLTEPAPAASATSLTPSHPLATNPAPEARALAAERASLLRIGAAKLTAGDATSAVIAYRQVAESSNDPDEQTVALLGLARAYRLSGDAVKAAATYELIVRDHPDHPQIPAAFLELGRTLRELGSPKLAIGSFYSVLQTTIKFQTGDSDSYRRLALTAQFEIADTHLTLGNYAEAVRFFNRLNLLDLSEADRARARFKSAQALTLSGDRNAAVLALQSFIADNPDDSNSPEARFMLATLLSALNRHDESLQVTLDLLRQEHGRVTGDSARWRVWQQRTGNQLANEFYSHGEITSALLIYQSLVALDDTSRWCLPVLYQVGLCQERLFATNDALETYHKITKILGDTPAEFDDLAHMTAWRIQQLTWLIRTQEELTILLKTRATTSSPPPANPAVSAKL